MSLNFQHSQKMAVSGPPEKKFICKVCGQSYFSRFTLQRHKKSMHGIYLLDEEESASTTERLFKCTFSGCSSIFSQAKNLRIHELRKHREPKKYLKNCPLCKEKWISSKEINHHFTDFHGIQIVISEHNFDSFLSFESWKVDIEKNTRSNYRKYRGDEMHANGIKSLFHCHRSGNYIPKTKLKKRPKKNGSHKINGFCPASMKVLWNEGKCKVLFTETHVGHTCDLKHMRLSKEDKFALATKIASNIPLNKILNSVKTSVNGEELERIHLLTRKDLNNIRRRFELSVTSEENEISRENSAPKEDLIMEYDPSQGFRTEEVFQCEKTDTIDLNARKKELKNKYFELIDSIRIPNQWELIEENYKTLFSTLNTSQRTNQYSILKHII